MHTQREMGLNFTLSMHRMDTVWKGSTWDFTDLYWYKVFAHQTASILAWMGVALILIYWKIWFCL